MKRVILIIAMFAVFCISAQHQPLIPAFEAETLTSAESKSLEADFQRIQFQRQAYARQKTNNMFGQRMSHAEVAAAHFGNLLKAVYTPFAPDSTYVQVLKGTANVPVHGIGQTFDPTSVGFDLLGQPYLTEKDSYTIDTIYVGVRYRTSAITSGFTGDTLKVVAFMGNKTNNSVWRVGIGYNANTWPNQPSRIEVLPPRYQGNPAIGFQGEIKAPGQMIFKYPLKGVDTAVNFIKIVPPTPIQVPAGHKFGVFCTFIPGYTYDPATQYYYFSGAKADVNNISWLYLTAQNAADKTPYFLESLNAGSPSEGISNQLISKTRYASWVGNDAFRNEYVAPSVNTANLIDFWVSGNSSVGLGSHPISGSVHLYPNPSEGMVKIKSPFESGFELSISNLQGQQLYLERVLANSNEVLERDFSLLPAGIYILNLRNEQQSYSGKIIIR